MILTNAEEGEPSPSTKELSWTFFSEAEQTIIPLYLV